MTNYDCSSCEELRTVDPSLAVSGLTKTECTSLKNDTGLVPKNGRSDCDDLDMMNDCLIGNMSAEINAESVCNWKPFVRKLIENVWTMFKGIICAICGIWANIHDMHDKIDNICELVSANIAPPFISYGTYPLDPDNPHICGTVTASLIHNMPDDGTLNPYTKAVQGIGIHFGKLVAKGCSGVTKTYEWIAPRTYLVELEPEVRNGDILWKCDRSTWQAMTGMTDWLWQQYTESSWTWKNCYLSPSRVSAYLKICIGTEGLTNNEIGVVYKGTSYPNDNLESRQEVASRGSEEARMYTH